MHFVIFGSNRFILVGKWPRHAVARPAQSPHPTRSHASPSSRRTYPTTPCARDGWQPPAGFRLRLYTDFEDIRNEAERELRDADVAMVTSYCPDGEAAAQARPRLPRARARFLRSGYARDPRRSRCRPNQCLPAALGPRRLRPRSQLHRRKALDRVAPHLGARVRRAPLRLRRSRCARARGPRGEFRADLSYLGTYAADRQPALEELSSARPAAARRPLPDRRARNTRRTSPGPATSSSSSTSSPRCIRPSSAPRKPRSTSLAAPWPTTATAPPAASLKPLHAERTILTDWWEGLDTFFAPGAKSCASTPPKTSSPPSPPRRRTAQHRRSRPRARPHRTHRPSPRHHSRDLLQPGREPPPDFVCRVA